ncbi:MAG: sensor histidine kinase [Verrucomicrobiota bacterium]
MSEPRAPSPRLRLACLLALAVALLGGLMLGVAGDRKGMRALPDEAGRSTVEVLEDPLAAFSFAEVREKLAAGWRAWDDRGYVRAGSGEAVWVRVTLRNPGATTLRGVLADSEYYTDRIDLWLKEPGTERWKQERAGEAVPAREKALWGRDAAFFVDVPAQGETTAYLRLEDHFGVWLRPVWWPEARTFLAAQLRDTVAETCYFGILLALLVYNGVLWARLRFADIGHYLGYLASGAAFMFMWRAQHPLVGWAAGSPLMETPLTVALAASGFFLARFGRVFLELEARVRWAERAARMMGLLMAILAVGALAIPWMNGTIWLHFAVGGVALTHAVLLAGAIAAWRAGAYHAPYFVGSFGLLLAGVLPAAIIWLLAVPLGISAMAMMLGSALEMLLLSLAIADRFARMQQEKIAAQERAVTEAEERRIVQEAYADELEHEVRERTRELVGANADKDRMIAVLGHDLRSPLTSLTLAAEQEAGVTARERVARSFALDTAQTGRALLLLLEDVVLWARLRAGAVQTVEHAAASVAVPAVELHRGGAERRGVNLRVEVDDGLRVRTDLVLAQTLVRNLVSNAVKLARSQVSVTVEQGCDAVAPVRVTVRDDGPGLPPAVAERLREWPEESRHTSNPWGARSGLGLRLCVEIAQAMGTRLEVAAPGTSGTEISFTLPRACD